MYARRALLVALGATLAAVRDEVPAPPGNGTVSGEPADVRAAAQGGVITSANAAPKLTSTLAAAPNAYTGMELRFTVTVDDPEGDPVSLELVEPQPWLVFQPVRDEAPPVTREVAWRIPPFAGGPRTLRFRAHDAVDPSASVELAIPIQVGGSVSEMGGGKVYGEGLFTGDVTGDGVPDLVGRAHGADVGGVADTGALYVWEGGVGGAPTATLTVPGASSGALLGRNHGRGVALIDVSGDGVLDVVAVASGAEVRGVSGAGAAYVWKGGPALAGNRPPDATLARPDPQPGDGLGWLHDSVFVDSQGLLFGDLNGDGTADLILAADMADVGGVVDAGAVFVWLGGADLSGLPAPSATLVVPGAGAGDRLGLCGGQGVQLADVTGDGYPDVVACASQEGADDRGAIHVWAGGAALAGTTGPVATLSVPQAEPGDQLGYSAYPYFEARYGNQTLFCADVTGDGTADVVACAPYADVGGATDAGALYVWRGGPALAGSVSPHATLTRPEPQPFDMLGYATIRLLGNSTGGGSGVHLVDLTGDGTLDLLALAPLADVGALWDVGVACLWEGGPSLAGAPPPRATLAGPGLESTSCFGGGNTEVLLFTDVTGDGVTDAIIGAPNAHVGYSGNSRIYVWAGGDELSGSPAPKATLKVDALSTSWIYLGLLGDDRGLLAVDVSGDGISDVVAASDYAESAYVWLGGAAMDGAPPPHASLPGLDMSALVVGDVTGDGFADILAPAPSFKRGSVFLAGAIHLWPGGPGLAGTTPSIELGLAAPAFSDHFGLFLELADLTADGVVDVVSGSRLIDLGGLSDVGAVALWQGAAALALGPGPDALLSIPGAVDNDNLTRDGVRIVDLDADGSFELLVAAPLTDLGGLRDVGAAHLWRLDGALPATTAPQETYAVPGALDFDMMSNGGG